LLERILIYGLAGWCIEVTFTALCAQLSGTGDARLVGQTYLWMHPIWAMGFLFVELAGSRLRERGLPWWARGLAYAAGAFVIEYGTGFVLRAVFGRAPWDYSGAALAVDGLIRLDYGPGWAMCGLTGERIIGLLHRIEMRVPRRPLPRGALPLQAFSTRRSASQLNADG
jgi:uncharacterized membrane protein